MAGQDPESALRQATQRMRVFYGKDKVRCMYWLDQAAEAKAAIDKGKGVEPDANAIKDDILAEVGSLAGPPVADIAEAVSAAVAESGAFIVPRGELVSHVAGAMSLDVRDVEARFDPVWYPRGIPLRTPTGERLRLVGTKNLAVVSDSSPEHTLESFKTFVRERNDELLSAVCAERNLNPAAQLFKGEWFTLEFLERELGEQASATRVLEALDQIIDPFCLDLNLSGDATVRLYATEAIRADVGGRAITVPMFIKRVLDLVVHEIESARTLFYTSGAGVDVREPFDNGLEVIDIGLIASEVHRKMAEDKLFTTAVELHLAVWSILTNPSATSPRGSEATDLLVRSCLPILDAIDIARPTGTLDALITSKEKTAESLGKVAPSDALVSQLQAMADGLSGTLADMSSTPDDIRGAANAIDTFTKDSGDVLAAAIMLRLQTLYHTYRSGDRSAASSIEDEVRGFASERSTIAMMGGALKRELEGAMDFIVADPKERKYREGFDASLREAFAATGPDPAFLARIDACIERAKEAAGIARI